MDAIIILLGLILIVNLATFLQDNETWMAPIKQAKRRRLQKRIERNRGR